MRINVIYFSCGRDEECLNISIESLLKHCSPNKIVVVSDSRDPITNPKENWIIEKQESSEKLLGLDNISKMISIFDKYKDDCDYIMKIDSDVVVTNSVAFLALEEGKFDAYGGHPMASEEMIPKNHFTGAAYFISSEFVKILNNRIQNNGWDSRVHHWSFIDYPEDMCISHMLNVVGANVKVDWSAMSKIGGYYWFDMFLSHVACNKEDIKKYSFAHCRNNKYLCQLIYECI